jgi:hypothetical protein
MVIWSTSGKKSGAVTSEYAGFDGCDNPVTDAHARRNYDEMRSVIPSSVHEINHRITGAALRHRIQILDDLGSLGVRDHPMTDVHVLRRHSPDDSAELDLQRRPESLIGLFGAGRQDKPGNLVTAGLRIEL